MLTRPLICLTILVVTVQSFFICIVHLPTPLRAHWVGIVPGGSAWSVNWGGGYVGKQFLGERGSHFEFTKLTFQIHYRELRSILVRDGNNQLPYNYRSQ